MKHGPHTIHICRQKNLSLQPDVFKIFFTTRNFRPGHASGVLIDLTTDIGLVLSTVKGLSGNERGVIIFSVTTHLPFSQCKVQ